MDPNVGAGCTLKFNRDEGGALGEVDGSAEVDVGLWRSGCSEVQLRGNELKLPVFNASV